MTRQVLTGSGNVSGRTIEDETMGLPPQAFCPLNSADRLAILPIRFDPLAA
ncbi:hypothetical protein BH23PLA1_BH23PLA1_16140 [soil metagenome]